MDKPANDLAPAQEPTNSIDLLAILNRRKSWLFLSCVLGLAGGAAYYFLTPKRYESRAELLLMQLDPEPSSAGGVERDVTEELLSTHMKLVQSSAIIRPALQMTREEATSSARMDPTKQANERQDDDALDGRGMQQAVSVKTKPVSTEARTFQPDAPSLPSDSPVSEQSEPKPAIQSTPAEQVPANSSGEAIGGLSPQEAILGLDPSEVESMPAGIEDDLGIEFNPNQLRLVDLPAILENSGQFVKPVDYVIKNMYVTTGGSGRARNARVLNIAFRHTSPEECELVTRAIVACYQEFVKNKFKDVNTDAAGLIAKAQEEIENKITALEAEYKKFRQASPLLSRGSSGTDIYTTRYEELATEISHLTIRRDEILTRLEMVKSTLAEYESSGAHNLQKLALIDERNAERLGTLVTVERGKAETAAFQSTQPERMAGANAEYSQLLTLRSRLSQLQNDFGPQYPEVKALQQQVSEIEGFLARKQKELFIGDDVQLTPDDVMKAYISMLEHDLRSSEKRAGELEKQMETAAAQAKELVNYQLEDESRVRALQREVALHDVVIERLREINMKKERAPLVLELIREPSEPEKVEPKGVVAAALAMLSALLLGGVGVLVAELRDRSVHSPEEFEEMLGSRVLAHLPNFQNDPEIRKLERVARKIKSPLSPSLLTFFAPDSRASETFRALRTQVMFSVGGDHKVLVTTSSNQGAGKSMLSSNMAVSMAGLGADVLLIDCDMRLPQVHRLFGVPNEKGLADAIVAPEQVDEFLVASGVEGLTLLPSGQSPANPAELLSRPEFKELLESLRQRFSFVILDCPPVLAVSDPSIVAPLADGVLFVTVVDNESRPKTLRSKRILEGVGAKVIGIVVNRSDESIQRYGYQAYGYESTNSADNYYAARPVR